MEPGSDIYELIINDSWSSIERIYFVLDDQNVRFMVRIETIESQEDRIYQYFRIMTSGISNDPDSTRFYVKVNKSWIGDSSIDTDTISFSMLDRKWEILPLKFISEDDGFIRYRAISPNLSSTFAVSGEPNPVDFVVTSPCNSNGVCESELGEDSDNCPDCIPSSVQKCSPAESYCIDNYLFRCSDDGTHFSYDECQDGCFDGECVSGAAALPTGMAVVMNPVIILVLTVMLAAIIYLTGVVKGMRNELQNVEKRKRSYHGLKALVKRKR
jgi:PGF-pre-PGF domain-containing protein